MVSKRDMWAGGVGIARYLSESKAVEVKDLRARLDQFQFCIDQVAHALGDVCCGGVDSSPENQMADPHSTTRVLCDAIAKLKKFQYADERDFRESLENRDGL